jgi:hypothetical protein
MAARENQGLQIALIIFALLTVILGATTYYFFNEMTKETAKLAKAEASASTAQQSADQALEQVSAIKALIGATPEEQVDAIKKRFDDTDMKKLGKTLPAAKQNYRQLALHLEDQRRKSEAANVLLVAQIKQLEEKITGNEQARTGEIKKYSDQAVAETKDKEQERGKFNEDRERFTKDTAEIKKVGEDARKKVEASLAVAAKDIQQLQGGVKSLNVEKQELLAKIEKRSVSSGAIDGKVTRVDQRLKSVWINVGWEEGLKQQVSFTVLPAGENNVEAIAKAKIEVTEVVGPHLATARIVEDDPRNPIVTGDKVFSPAWEAGEVQHFALVGLMDLDGDGSNDRQKVRGIIELNGGVIDAELTDEGKVLGPGVSVKTDFLVLGERPTDAAAKNKGEKFLDNYAKLIDQAEKSGVQSIKVDVLMRQIGYDADLRTVPLGKDARPEDFQPRYPGLAPKSTGNVSEFRSPPPAAGKKAADDAKPSTPPKKSAY